MCLGVCGKVVNVSTSENILPDTAYGKIWAGKDATFALATMSLSPSDANRLSFTMNDFSEQQLDTLAGWYKHFTSKYPVVGSLKEYEAWDFSSVQEAAKSKTPFGSNSSN